MHAYLSIMLKNLWILTINHECYIILECTTHQSCVHIRGIGCVTGLSATESDDSCGSGTCVRAYWNVRVKAPIATSSQQGRARQDERARSCWLPRLCRVARASNASCERSHLTPLKVKTRRTRMRVRKRSCERGLTGFIVKISFF